MLGDIRNYLVRDMIDVWPIQGEPRASNSRATDISIYLLEKICGEEFTFNASKITSSCQTLPPNGNEFAVFVAKL